ncbi:DUF3365 domain-containing protein [Verrucomicrobiaceae bacterium R5-34]|nr:DUF3365 domain-containing protein [Verrucomicrobiaceae bacterium R5-34]
MNHYLLLAAPLMLLMYSSCDRPSTADTTVNTTDHSEAAEIGEQASAKLMKTLGTQLKSALQQGGPENALHVCQQIAQPLTAEVSRDDVNFKVTRTALKVRNPLNAPDVTSREIMEKWQRLMSGGEDLPEHEIIESGDQLVFYKPIMTQEICLKCHGDSNSFSAELRSNLNRLYPKDEAIGFKKGDLRGAFRVEISTDGL